MSKHIEGVYIDEYTVECKGGASTVKISLVGASVGRSRVYASISIQ